jgi:DNA replicative helicase MCM subunit Mcm2 (Cdc46/Mcm family)
MDLNLEEIEKTEGSPFVERFEEFFNAEYKKHIERIIESYPEDRSLLIDFKALEKFDPILADELLDNPDAVLEAAQTAVQNIHIPTLTTETFKPHVRFYNLPRDREIDVRNISSKHIGKMICVEGLVRLITDVLPKMLIAVWKCRRCGNVYRIPQEKQQLRPPNMCECHSKEFSIEEEKSIFIDSQKVQLQETLEKLKGNEQATYLDVYVTDDLVNKVAAGDKTKFVGILRLLPPQKDKKTVYGRYLEVNSLEETAREFSEIDITKEEEEEIRKLSKNPQVYEMLAQSVAPAIYGHEIVKESIALQLFGGVTKHLPNGQKIRGNAHILLIGDPGTAKSQLLMAANNIAPKSIYISGKTSTGAGLCVAPDTLVLNDSGFKPIKEFVEENFRGDGKEELPGCKSSEYNQKGFTLGEDLKIKDGIISKVWRIKAPEKMIKLKSRFGKELSLTPNTSLIRIKSGILEWVKASEIKEGDFVATARKLPESKETPIYCIEILKKNKNIKIQNNLSKQFKEITDSLIKKGFYKDLTELAKKIGKSRDTVYGWRIPKHYHGIPLHTFMELAEQDNKNAEEISEYITELFISHGKNYKIPRTINNLKLAYLAGILFGDGSIYLSPKSAQMRLYNNSKEVLNAFDETMLELFGIETEKYEQKGVGARRAASLIVYELLKEFGLSSKKLENKLSHSATEMKIGNINCILSGLFDTDGFVSTSKNGSIGLSTISKQLAQTIQLALLKSEILAKIRKRKVAGRISKGKEITVHSKNAQYYIEITGSKNAKLFMEKIGFSVQRKQNALKSIIKETPNPNLDIIPEIKELLQNKKIKWEYRKGKRNPSREKLLEISNETGNDKLKSLAESDILWEEIIEKQESKPEYEYVYDFTVEGTHNFIANGFITHNTATAVKDEFGEGGWTLKAGALVLSSGGVCMADELDKMDSEDRSALHEAMEQGMISVAKAGIVSRFKADTSLLAAANPKYSRFDKFTPVLEQIDLPPSLISRFDLFFMIRDVLDKTLDQKISEHILKTHQSGEKLMQSHQKGEALKKEEKEEIDKRTKPIVDTALFSKYVSFARQKCFPILSEESMNTISEFYVNLREQGRAQGAYAATARQLEGLVRLAEASARVRLSDAVDIEDAHRAIRLVKKSLEETVVDPETGRIDIDIITTGVTQAKQNAITTILRLIKESMATGIDMVPIEEIMAKGIEKGLDETRINTALDELEKKGEIYKPRHHFVKPTTHKET